MSSSAAQNNLQEYRRKRDFKKTLEPAGSAEKAQGRRFVVQKHAASRLHYDFRLEEEGVLKSWAVPKGPSLDPAQRRLAVAVEDHPLEYGSFEGIIPKGQYGGGTVMVWDEGEWEPLEDATEGLRKGRLKFRLYGSKLHGGWSLIRLADDPNWLLIKEKDDFAEANREVTALDKSVVSGRSLDEVAQGAERVWNSHPAGPALYEAKGARRISIPTHCTPQLATLRKGPPTGEEWLHEIKYDGYRLLAYLNRGQVRLITRGQQDWTDKFPGIARALAQLPVDQAIIDGEVVVLDVDGRSNFQRLQQMLKDGRGEQPSFYGFDLLYCQDYDLRPAPLVERKQALEKLLHNAARPVHYSRHIRGSGQEILQQACQLGCEGIVSKRADSSYSGRRSLNWVKSKCLRREEFSVMGYTDPQGARQGLGSLVLAQPRGQEFKYCGRVGTGFTAQILKELYELLQPLASPQATAEHDLSGAEARQIHWVQPQLRVLVAYSERTDKGILRHPSFQKLLPRQGPRTGVKISHPERVLDPSSGVTKGELAEYYERVGEWLLPHLTQRPLTLVRCPNGFGKESFYQKHRADTLPAAVKSITVSEGDETVQYIMIDTLDGLLSLVQMGAVEFHPWGSREEDLDQPDRLIFDLDPDVGLSWDRVVEASLAVRDRLAQLGLQAFCKTTGGKGLHVVLPLQRRADWVQSKAFAKALAEGMEKERPDQFTSNPLKVKRKGRIYVDYLRNGKGATAVAAYSARAREGCPISLPIAWDDVTSQLQPTNLSIRQTGGLEARGQVAWADFLHVRQSLTQSILKKLGIGLRD